MFENIYFGKKVVVTGHTGFKGAWLSIWLKMLGADVFGIANQVYEAPSLYEEAHVGDGMTSYMADIRDLTKMKEIFSAVQPDFVFHLAAQAIVKAAYIDPVECMTTNIIGTVNILEALRGLTNDCAVVMITSDKCYDNVEWIWGYRETDALGGKDPYSASKGGAELMIKTYYHSYFKGKSNIKISSVRAGNVIGGGDWAANRIVPDCFRAWSNHETVIIRSPLATRPWQHVLEPLSGYLMTGLALATQEGINGEAFNFGPPTDRNFTVIDLLHKLAERWSPEGKDIVEIQPSDFYEAGLLKLNIDKALYLLSWRPTLNFQQTADTTCDWYRNFYQQRETGVRQFTENQIQDYMRVAQQCDILWALK
jgi:CDP-glucose 4,6-dehydratase